MCLKRKWISLERPCVSILQRSPRRGQHGADNTELNNFWIDSAKVGNCIDAISGIICSWKLANVNVIHRLVNGTLALLWRLPGKTFRFSFFIVCIFANIFTAMPCHQLALHPKAFGSFPFAKKERKAIHIRGHKSNNRRIPRKFFRVAADSVCATALYTCNGNEMLIAFL